MINDSVANIGIQPGDRQLNVQAIQQLRPGQGFHAVPMPQRVSATLLKFHFPAPKNRLTRTQPLRLLLLHNHYLFNHRCRPSPGRRSPKLRGMINALWVTATSQNDLRLSHLLRMAPTNGGACLEGWMNIGAGYCKKKRPLGTSHTQTDRHQKRQHKHLPTSEFEGFFDPESVT